MATQAARHRWRIASAVVALVALLAVLGAEGYSRSKFHQDFWAAGPDRIHVCERDYLGPGDTHQLSQLRARYPQIEVVGEVATLQGTRQVWGAHNPARDRTLPPDECGIVVYMQTGGDEVLGYGLSGGP